MGPCRDIGKGVFVKNAAVLQDFDKGPTSVSRGRFNNLPQVVGIGVKRAGFFEMVLEQIEDDDASAGFDDAKCLGKRARLGSVYPCNAAAPFIMAAP